MIHFFDFIQEINLALNLIETITEHLIFWEYE